MSAGFRGDTEVAQWGVTAWRSWENPSACVSMMFVVRQQPAEVCRAQLNPHFTAEKNESLRDEETHLPASGSREREPQVSLLHQGQAFFGHLSRRRAGCEGQRGLGTGAHRGREQGRGPPLQVQVAYFA